jgi:hypothetical protein
MATQEQCTACGFSRERATGEICQDGYSETKHYPALTVWGHGMVPEDFIEDLGARRVGIGAPTRRHDAST